MPPLLKSLPSRKKNGQFTARVGQPPSSLASPPTPCPTTRDTQPPSRSASPSSRLDLLSIIGPSSELDDAPTFDPNTQTHSQSESPTIPALNRSRSPSPSTSDLSTSLESSQLDNDNGNKEWRFIIPAGLDTTSMQFLPPTLIPQPHLKPSRTRTPIPPLSNLPPQPMFQTSYIPRPISSISATSTGMSNTTSAGSAAIVNCMGMGIPTHFPTGTVKSMGASSNVTTCILPVLGS